MVRAFLTPAGLGTLAVAALLGACDARKAGTESANATVTDTAAATSPTTRAPSPSRPPRRKRARLYLKGRDLSENLRAHDGRKLYAAGGRGDPAFAMAHYQLAANSATAKDFFAAPEAGRGSRRQGVRRRAAHDPGARGRRQRQAGQGARVLSRAGDQVSRRRAGPLPPRRRHTSGSRSTRRRSSSTPRRPRSTPSSRPAYNSIGYAYRPLEKYADAEVAFKKYIELIPDDPNPYDSYAELLMKTGRFDESIAQYRKALEMDSELHAVAGRASPPT